MRRHYRHELNILEQELLALGRLVEHTVQRTMWALRHYARNEAQAIIHDDNAIDDAAAALTDHATSVIAREGPVAGDLRVLTSFILCASELERIGDYAEGIARLILRADNPLPADLCARLDVMATEGRMMLSDALDALTTRNPDIGLRLKHHDDRVDQHYKALFNDTTHLMQQAPEHVLPGTYVLWIGHNLERLADRTTNIGEYVEYMVRGTISDRPA